MAVLLTAPDRALRFFAERDLLGRRSSDVRDLWHLKPATAILAKQAPDGSWPWKGLTPGHETFGEDYQQLETFRRMGQLVELYGFDRRHSAIERAAEYLFSCQTSEGDFRGIYGRHYTPNYTGAILELLVKAGYADDARVRQTFKWLLYMRQSDGGWTLPVRTLGLSCRSRSRSATPEPDRSKPFSHLITGMVLRAFAAHPTLRRSAAARNAASLLAGRFFLRDAYPERGAASFWDRPTFPFWFTDALSGLDSVTRIGVAPNQISDAIEWLLRKRDARGVFRFEPLKNKSIPNLDLWLTLAACRVLKRVDEASKRLSAAR